MALSELWAVEMLIAAFAGGAFGAALGALPAFIFTGFLVIAGETAVVANAEAGSITGSVAFGEPFSPAISFAGGAAAAAYAAKRGYMDSGFDYHNAKDIAFALGTKPDVLAVGGLFGILGYWITIASQTYNLPWDPIAMGVTLSALAHRVAFGYPLVGKIRGDGPLDMSPFEREEIRVGGEAAADGDGETDGGTASRLAVEPWLPHQYKWANVAAVSLVVGLLGAFIAMETGSIFLAFGISAASLVFLNLGVERIPVTHHMSLIGSAGALAAVGGPDGSLLVGLIAGGVLGLISGLFGELFQRVFYSHSDTHWDPPAAAIVFGSFLIVILYIIGVFPSASYVPTLGF
ncbi:hypothetical protein GL213_08395 [Halogeometricum borinquense]|uniref:DUF7973 domain-containing protein n=1 Tax=Halogeometricum borinquense TaxID=60847 RepID=A0A6C0UGA8_9EURY|nr:hypothetical protein [Halogeometricum borinquense]QIB74516.1 hypothetical protein G3I44_09630 [Halogeometricum borinquense]QIQ76539.1 hypothetical protein GL213_08395 [Halogeometricum borinquense]